MKGRTRVAGSNTGGGGASPDLLVCFPSRARLALMPKPICSPSRPLNLSKRNPNRTTNRGKTSPLFRSKSGNHSGVTANDESITDEPTSPTVNCAGQIKIRARSSSGPKPGASSSGHGRGLFSVVEEIERFHKHGKKPLMQFLGVLRSMRLDLRCFGSFHGAVDCSSDEEEADEAVDDVEEEEEDNDLEDTSSKTLLSKWFMLLEENKSRVLNEEESEQKEEEEEEEEEVVPPPPNALLLMRCRSAPAKGEAKVSTEIAKETWVVGNLDPLSRSRSWKR